MHCQVIEKPRDVPYVDCLNLMSQILVEGVKRHCMENWFIEFGALFLLGCILPGLLQQMSKKATQGPSTSNK